MGEKWAIEAINSGLVTIGNTEYFVTKSDSGSCDGCVFMDQTYCPRRAVTVCSTGGNILIEKDK